ncbi:MAG TPA: hypothetical protein VFN86_05435 [Casimicrobiaceae bacterium]|nr:hypothetical protein [Casimicrobiaceae bacterium]
MVDAPAALVDAAAPVEVDVDGVAGAAADLDSPALVVAALSSAFATPYPDKPTAEAISAYAMLVFNLRIMAWLLSYVSGRRLRPDAFVYARSLPA